MTGQRYDQPLMAAAPVWMQRPLHDRTLGPSACKDLRLSPQHNPTQLNPVTGRPLITPVRQAKNNSRGLNLGCDKIKMSLWLWVFSCPFLITAIKTSSGVKPTSRVHFLTLLSCLLLPCFPSSNLTWSESLQHFFLFGYLACCVNHYNYSKSVVENVLEKLGEDGSRRTGGGGW